MAKTRAGQVLPRRALAPDALLLPAQGIEPKRHRPAGVFDRFGAAIMADSFIRNQRVAHQTAARMWNRVVASVPGWPADRHRSAPLRQALCPAHSRRSRLRSRRTADWLRRLAGEGMISTTGLLRPLRPRSLERRGFYLRQAASALVESGRDRDPTTIVSLADLVTVEAMQTILRFFLARSGCRPTSQIHGLANHLKAIARHHVGVPPAVLEQLGRMVRRLGICRPAWRSRTGLPSSRSKTQLLLGRLGYGCRLRSMQPCRGSGRSLPPRTALRFHGPWRCRSCSATPIRLGNLAGLGLGRHLLTSGTGRTSLR